MSAVSQRPVPMTTAEFLDWSPDQPGRWQLYDGEPWCMAPATPRHNLIQAEAARVIGNHLASRRPHCRVGTEPGVQPRVRSRVNLRIPDLAISCTPLDVDARLWAEPMLLIEIVSRTNAKDTWDNVWAYTTIPSVREILVLHMVDIRAELLRRDPDGTWPENPTVVAAGDALILESIELTVPLAAFYRTAAAG
jgi:Uma2 family endonuclease